MQYSENDLKCLAVQKMVFDKTMNGRAPNAYTVERENWRAVTENGRLVINDVPYADRWPNSFVDIWYPNEDTTKKRPVLVNFHGGGFIFGSRKTGDPLQVSASDGEGYLDGFLSGGFVIVNGDYGLAPDCRFPVQIFQVDQVFRFVLEHAEEYGFDTSNMSLTGGSAGANLTELYAAAVTNPDYARALGLEPVLKPGDLRCVIVNEAALQLDTILRDHNMLAMTRFWWGTDDVEHAEAARLTDVAAFVGGSFPPAFLVASSQGDFFRAEQLSMEKALKKAGVPCESFFIEREVCPLDHGFLNQYKENEYATDCYRRVLSFLKRYTN